MPTSDQARWFSRDVQLFEPALRAYLRKRFPSLPDHDDIVQETYRRLLREREKGRLIYAKAFLFTAARNVALDTFRRRRACTNDPLFEVVALPVLEDVPGAVEALEHQQRLELLVEAVSALPERCRQVMMLRHLEGLSYKEIAVRLEISPETVKVHLVKGVRDCVAFFRKHGLLESPAVAALVQGAAR